MDEKQLQKYQKWLYSKMPLIGGWLRHKAVKALASAVREGHADAARVLAEAVTRSDDTRVRSIALEALSRIETQPCIDAVCEVWANTRHNDLTQLLIEHKWVATTPPQLRVLSALKVGQLKVVTEVEPEGVQPLVLACGDEDADIAQRALQCVVALKNPNAVDYLCHWWVETRHQFLEQVIVQAGYVAQWPIATRVLSALKLGRRELITGLGSEVVSPLVAACQDQDTAIAEQARLAIVELTNPQAREAIANQLCTEWAKTRSPALEDIIVRGRYVASQPLSVRVLSALKTKQRQLLTELGAEVVEPLVKACEDRDLTIAEQARLTLRQLKNVEAREAVCRLVIERDHPIAREAAIEGKYTPRDEYQRALFFFLTEQWKRYEDLDFDHRLLRTVYESADPALRQRIIEKLRASGRPDFLTIIVGGDYRSRVQMMKQDEIKFLVQMLTENKEWAKLWALVFELPFFWSVSIVKTLSGSGWKPEIGDERMTFEELVSLASAGIVMSVEEVNRVLPPAVQRARARVSGRVNDVAFSPIRPVIAIGTGQRKVVLWNFQLAQCERVLDGFEHSVGRVTFMPDGTLLCGERTNLDAPCAIRCWRDEKLFKLTQHSRSVTALEPVGESQALSAGRDQWVVLWDIKSCRRINQLFLDTWVRGARVSFDGQRVALLHDGVTLMALPQLNEIARTQEWFWKGVSCCAAFAPDGTALIVGKFNGDVLVCRRNGQTLNPEERALFHHDGQVRDVEVLSNRSVIISGGSEGRLQFTSWETRNSIGSVEVPGERLTSLHVSPDGEFMAVGDSDASMSLWDLRVMDVVMLFARPFAQAVPIHLAAVSALVQSANLDSRVRHALKFMECVLRHRFRYDIEIDEVPTIKPGEFDIEIE